MSLINVKKLEELVDEMEKFRTSNKLSIGEFEFLLKVILKAVRASEDQAVRVVTAKVVDEFEMKHSNSKMIH